ncbi:class I SAM-dependent methyltransferase [Rufibacter immobilis]|uniref:class I SAM-dependent methyltransferase n=1 Tax=Rufibacter immobilis TaxID=1348778 RepID=UPI0035EFB5D7
MSTAPAPDFDFIAPVYDALAQLVFGKAQQKAQAQFLELIPPGARVLVLGGGSGWLLARLLQKSNPAYVLYLEASSQMLRKARTRYQNFSSAGAEMEFRLGTQDQLLPNEKFHVVLTPFVLDLFTAPQALHMMQRLTQALLPGGLWLHTDFYLAPEKRRQIWQKPLLWAMYRFFRQVSGISGTGLPPFEALFSQVGFVTKQEAFFFHRFIRAQVLQKPLGS